MTTQKKMPFVLKINPQYWWKKDHSSRSAKLFCLQIHFFSHRRIRDIWMDIQSSDAPPSSERLMFPLFLDPCAWKKQPRKKKKKNHDAGNETRLPVARLSWQSGPLYLCSTLLPFHSLRYFANRSTMAPKGKTAENRMWIHLPLTSTREKPVLQCKLSRHAYLMYFLAVFQWNRIMLLSGKQFHFISLASRDTTEEQLWLFAECCMEIKLHQPEISV